jgi:hypothetical protein
MVLQSKFFEPVVVFLVENSQFENAVEAEQNPCVQGVFALQNPKFHPQSHCFFSLLFAAIKFS